MGNTFGAHIFKRASVGEREEVTIKLFKPDGTPLYLDEAPEVPAGVMNWLGEYDEEAIYPPGAVVRGGGKTYIVVGTDNMPVGIGLGVNPGIPTFRGFVPQMINAYGVQTYTITSDSLLTPIYTGRTAQNVALAAIRVLEAGTLSVKAELEAGNHDTEFALYSAADSVTALTHTDDVFGSAAGLNAYAITPGLYFLLGTIHNDATPSLGVHTWTVGPAAAASTAVIGEVLIDAGTDAHWEQVA